METLYIDITQLVNWSGRLTGIPRSMNELASRFAIEPNCQMVTWDSAQGQFVKTDYTNLDRIDPKLSTSMAVKSGLKEIIKKSKLAYPVAAKIYNVKQTNSKKEAVTFKPGDLLFISWGMWDQEPYIKGVLRAKAEGASVAQIVHDMLPLVEPQFSGHSTASLYNYATQIYPQCDLLIAVSECTKTDTTNWLKLHSLHVPEIKVIRWGEDFIAGNPAKPKDIAFVQAKLKGQDYILCVGTIEARKNHTLLYYVYKLANQNGVKLPKTIVVGRRGWMTENIYEIITNDPKTKDNIIFLENISDEELTWLYANCLFSIYPSFYEGWGLPIAESLARGVPCISSSTSSMPEIAGDLIDYFSPYSPEECLASILKLTDKKNLAKATEKITSYKPTSWDKTYKSVKMYIKEI